MVKFSFWHWSLMTGLPIGELHNNWYRQWICANVDLCPVAALRWNLNQNTKIGLTVNKWKNAKPYVTCLAINMSLNWTITASYSGLSLVGRQAFFWTKAGPNKQTSMKFKLLQWRKRIWKYRLLIFSHCVSAAVCFNSGLLSVVSVVANWIVFA